MEEMITGEAMSLKQFGDDCFGLTKSLQTHVENATVRVGTARFIVGGYEGRVAYTYEGDDALVLTYKIDAAPDQDVSFMCAKAMVYGLYTAARDVMIREHSTPIAPTGRVIHHGSTASASATIGAVIITMDIYYGSAAILSHERE